MSERARTHGSCRACGTVRPIEEMRAASGSEVDLDTMLTNAFLCGDHLADECRSRACGRSKKMFIAIEPAEVWGGGNVHLITDDPRRAEEHAAALGGVTVHLLVHSDYRKG